MIGRKIPWIIELTSLPTYPISVYLVASTRKKGAFVRRANLLAISVFPQPVGPLSSKFLGVIYVFICSGSSLLLHLFLNAQAIAFLASFCPITNLSRYSTSLWGVRSDYAPSADFSSIFLNLISCSESWKEEWETF